MDAVHPRAVCWYGRVTLAAGGLTGVFVGLFRLMSESLFAGVMASALDLPQEDELAGLEKDAGCS